MSNISYTYNKQFDDLMQIDTVIKNQGFLNSYCSSDNNGTSIHFDSALTNQEEISLSNLINNFNEVTSLEKGTCQSVLTIPRTTNNQDWTSLCAWAYPGQNNALYQHINVNSFFKTDSANNTYQLRVYDSINNTVIGTTTLSNTENMTNMICVDPLNLPFSVSSFELHGKVSNSNDTIQVKHVCVVY
jgi:hypothetical protein